MSDYLEVASEEGWTEKPPFMYLVTVVYGRIRYKTTKITIMISKTKLHKSGHMRGLTKQTVGISFEKIFVMHYTD